MANQEPKPAHVVANLKLNEYVLDLLDQVRTGELVNFEVKGLAGGKAVDVEYTVRARFQIAPKPTVKG